MNLDASPETIRAVAEVLELASLLDDRVAGADPNRIKAWSEQVERHKLLRGDLLDGLQKFYDGPAERPIGVGDLIYHSRQVRHDRTEREDDRRVYRPSIHDQQAVDEARAFAADLTFGRVKNPTPRFEAAVDALQTCRGRRDSMAAIREFAAAKREAQGKWPARVSDSQKEAR